MILDEVKMLYTQGLSAREVGIKFNMTPWQVIRLMKKNNVPRRKPEDTQRLQFAKKPLSYNRKFRLSPSEEALFHAGLFLYWAEGAKSKNNVVDFANSNEQMVGIFVRMLRQVYHVTEKRLRVLLYCFANQDPKKLTLHWATILQIPTSQFTKPYIRYDFDPNKTDRMPHGLVHIRYNDKRLLMQIFKDIDIISSTLLKS